MPDGLPPCVWVVLKWPIAFTSRMLRARMA